MERKRHIFHCKKCGREYTLLLSNAELNANRYSHHCSRACANSRSFSNESRLKKSQSNKSKIEHDGLWGAVNRENFEFKQYICRECGKPFDRTMKRNIRSTNFCSKECSNLWRHKHTGGYRRNAGRGKQGWYKGIWCDSSWELAFVIYHIDHGMSIKRCEEKRTYEFEGKQFTYNPDFITDEGIVEIKGYSDSKWEAKIKSNPDIKVLFEKDISYILEYVIEKYGKDFIKLYE